MELSSRQQICELANKSDSILVCLPKNPDGDAIASSLGVFLILEKLGKKATLVCPTAIPENFLFLPASQNIIHKLEGIKEYMISLGVERKNLEQLRYEVNDHNLNIFITAKDGDLEKRLENENIKLEPAKFKYDLIIILGVQDIESLGSVYDENSELFFETPIINIDHHPSNEYFGKVNLVEITASSTAEIITAIYPLLKEDLLDKKIATLLLAGIIFSTESFQNKNTTPNSLTAAASLIAAGADQQKIIRYLFKTKPVSILKLMGKIMADLKYSSRYKLAWSIISPEDFRRTSAVSENLHPVIKELINSSPEIDIILLLYKDNATVRGIINLVEQISGEELSQALSGELKDNQIIFDSKEESFEAAERVTLERIKKWADGNNNKQLVNAS